MELFADPESSLKMLYYPCDDRTWTITIGVRQSLDSLSWGIMLANLLRLVLRDHIQIQPVRLISSNCWLGKLKPLHADGTYMSHFKHDTWPEIFGPDTAEQIQAT